MIDMPAAPCEDLALSTRLVMLEGELAQALQQRDRLNGELAAARARIAQLGELASRPLEEAQELEEEPEAIPCLVHPQLGMLACPEAMFGAGAAGGALEGLRDYPQAAQCHQVLVEKAPAIVRMAELAERVVGP